MVSKLGKYLLLERVNQGGMADVYLAKTFGFGGADQLIALKCIRPEVHADATFVSMFVDEAKLSSLLSHQNIARTYELGKIDDAYYIAMEYVSGRDVRAVIDRARARNVEIPPALALYIVAAILDGLDYAHRKADFTGAALHIVHSDVSPKNVLIGYAGELKLIDFGVARAVMNSEKTSGSSVMAGKIAYASPEQATGRSVGSRSDIYAVGALFFELLTRTPLFDGASDGIVLDKVKQGEIYPPSLITPSIPADIEAIVLKALACAPDDRYQSAENMHADVIAALIRHYGHQQPRDLATFVKKLFEEEHKSETTRIEQAMRITAMPERVPAYEASGVERTAMVDLSSLAAMQSLSPSIAAELAPGEPEPEAELTTPGGGDAPVEDTNPGAGGEPVSPVEATRIASVFDSDLAQKQPRKPINYTFGADADDEPDDGATAIVRQSDVKRHSEAKRRDTRSGETAIVRGQYQGFGFDVDDNDAGETAIVRDRRPTIDRSRPAGPDAWLSRPDERNEATDPSRRSPLTENTDRARVRRGDLDAEENTDRVMQYPQRRGTTRVPTGPQGAALGNLYAQQARQNRLLIGVAIALGLVIVGLVVALVATLNKAPQPVGTIGSLVIVSQPLGAEVVLDGSVIGTTPYSSSRIPVGRHDIIVRDLGGRSKHQVVTIEPVGVSSLDINLADK